MGGGRPGRAAGERLYPHLRGSDVELLCIILAVIVGAFIAEHIILIMFGARWGLTHYEVKFNKKPPKIPSAGASAQASPPKPGSGTGVAPDAEAKSGNKWLGIAKFGGVAVAIGVFFLAILFVVGAIELNFPLLDR